ncbi:MAG: hypothetical protein IT462_09415 [Planctomycetes bacterium]|nr:hypothetical protein [Planctomycetota bacterium]
MKALIFALALLAPALHATTIAPPMFVTEQFNGEIVCGVNLSEPAYCGRNFGAGVIGQQHAVTIRVWCGSGPPLLLQTPTITSGGADFSVNVSGFVTGGLEVGQHTEFEILFSASSTGPKAGVASFGWRDGDQWRDFSINVVGEGVAAPVPVLRVSRGSPTGMPFYPEIAGWVFGRDGNKVDPPLTVFVSNIGEAGAPDLTLSVPTSSGEDDDISLDVAGFATSLAPGASTSFVISAYPRGYDFKDALVTFTHNDTFAVESPFDFEVATVEFEPYDDDKWYEGPDCAAAPGAAWPAGLGAMAVLALWRRRKVSSIYRR